MTPIQIRALRSRFQETQEEFARHVGVSVTAISSWERGEVVPSRLALDRLTQILRSAPKDPLLAVEA